MVDNKIIKNAEVKVRNDMVRSGDVLLIAIPNYLGHQQGGTRYGVVVSNNIGNKYSPTIKVVLSTSNKSKYNDKKQSTHAKFGVGEIDGLNKDTVFMAESELVINKFQIIKKVGEKVGELNEKQLLRIAIAKAFADPLVLMAFNSGIQDTPKFQNVANA
jgi:mRNA interferase MazF